MAAVNSGTFSGTAAALGSVKLASGKGIVFTYTTNGAETLNVTGAVANAIVSSKIMCYSLVTGALHSTVDMVAGTYFIPQVFTGSIIFTGSGSSDAKVVSFHLSNRE